MSSVSRRFGNSYIFCPYCRNDNVQRICFKDINSEQTSEDAFVILIPELYAENRRRTFLNFEMIACNYREQSKNYPLFHLNFRRYSYLR